MNASSKINLRYLYVSIKCCMMKTCSAGPVRNVDISKHWYEVLSTFNGIIRGSHMKWSLPVLITRIDVRLVA